MPVCYQFKNKDTNQIVELTKIDEEMCVDLEMACHEKHWCFLYTFISNLGTLSKLHNERGCVDREKLEAWLNERCPELEGKERELTFKYLTDKYEFSAWWQSKN